MERDGRLEAGIPARLTRAEGRRFALVVGGAFIGLATLLFWRDRQTLGLAGAALGVPLLIAGLLVPDRLGPVQRAWMRLALAISRVTTPVFMALLFFLVITPAGLIGRLLGRKPLVRPATGGVWIRREPGSHGYSALAQAPLNL